LWRAQKMFSCASAGSFVARPILHVEPPRRCQPLSHARCHAESSFPEFGERPVPECQPGPSLAAARSGTTRSLIGVGIPCDRPRRRTTPFRQSHSSGRPACRSARIEVPRSVG
jgi:hypothetical protein